MRQCPDLLHIVTDSGDPHRGQSESSATGVARAGPIEDPARGKLVDGGEAGRGGGGSPETRDVDEGSQPHARRSVGRQRHSGERISIVQWTVYEPCVTKTMLFGKYGVVPTTCVVEQADSKIHIFLRCDAGHSLRHVRDGRHVICSIQWTQGLTPVTNERRA